MSDAEKPAPYSRPRLSRSEGEIALLTAAIELMREKHPSEVTTGDIADRAGLNRAHIVRYFGTRLELLSAAIEYEFQQHLAPEPLPEVLNIYLDNGNLADLMNWRNKVVTYLLNSEVPASRFQESQRIIIDRFSRALSTGDLSPRMSRTLAIISVLLTQGYQAYGELDELTTADRHDIFAVTTRLAAVMGPIDKELGWNK